MPLGGTIHSYVVTHYPQVPSFEYPLPVLLVDLDPDPQGSPSDRPVRLVVNTVDNALDGLRVGARVRIVIEKCDDDLSLPFAVVEEAATNKGAAK